MPPPNKTLQAAVDNLTATSILQSVKVDVLWQVVADIANKTTPQEQGGKSFEEIVAGILEAELQRRLFAVENENPGLAAHLQTCIDKVRLDKPCD